MIKHHTGGKIMIINDNRMILQLLPEDKNYNSIYGNNRHQPAHARRKPMIIINEARIIKQVLSEEKQR